MLPTSWSYIIEALGGLALFIFGMRTMSEGLQKVTGERLRRLLEKGAGNRLTAPLIGSCLASLLQSGSAASVLVVGFVNAGLLSLYQALGVLLGTGIGTTIAIQFIALRVTALALPAITVGVFLSLFSRRRRIADFGRLLLGVGLVFFGLAIMEQACAPFSHSAILAGVRENLHSVRLMAVLLGAVLTFLVQSGSATLGIVIALASGGILSYDASIAMVIGEVAGAALIPLIASIGGSQAAKRAVVIYMGITGAAIGLALIFFPLFLRVVDLVSPGDISSMQRGGSPQLLAQARPHIARHLANAHTIFTVCSAVVFLPLIGFLARSAEAWLPTRRSESEPRPRFIDVRVLKTPTIALAQAWSELGRMGGIAGAMYRELISQFDDYNPQVAAAISDRELVLDVLHRDMSQFLIALSRQTLSLERAVEIPLMLQMVNDIELVGDQCEAVLRYLIRKKEEGLRFSASAMDELKRFAAKAGEAVALCERVLKGEEVSGLPELKLELATLEDELQKSHLRRLKSGRCSIVAGLLYGDMIAGYSKIYHLCFSIMGSMKGIGHDSDGSGH